MKKKLMLVLVIALIMGCIGQPYTVSAATKAKKETKVDGVKVNDLISGKFNNIDIVEVKNEYVLDGYRDWTEKKKVNYYKETETYTQTIIVTDKGLEYTNINSATEIYKNNNGKKTTDSSTWQYYNSAQKFGSNEVVSEDDFVGTVKTITLTKDMAKFGLVASRFKVSKTKLTDTEIKITGTYTFKVPSYKDQSVSNYESIASTLYDYSMWGDINIMGYTSKKYKDIKSNVTLIFDRETKQIISADIKCTMPKGGYKLYRFDKLFSTYKSYTQTYTFTHK